MTTLTSHLKFPEIYAVMSPKGGVGKSTSLSALALYISEVRNQKVLLLDLDNIATLTNNFQGDKVRFPELSNVTDLYEDPDGKEMLKVSVVRPNIHLVQGDSKISEINSKNSIELISLLEDNLHQRIPDVSSYDYILIDTPAGVGNSVLSALICSDFIYSPIDLDTNSISAIDELTRVLKPIKRRMNPKLAWKGLLINRVAKLVPVLGSKLPEALNHRKIYTDITSKYSGVVLGVVCNRNAIQRAVTSGQWITGRDQSALDAIREVSTFCENLLETKA